MLLVCPTVLYPYNATAGLSSNVAGFLRRVSGVSDCVVFM